jgi:PAS domain S-box-containing protein
VTGTDELERQRQFFESLLEISPVAIITTDLDATVTSWNPQAERLFGYTREEAVGQPIDGLIAASPELREDAERVKEEALAAGRYEGVARRSRKDGTVVDVEVLAVPIVVDGDQVGFYAIYHDVSELQRQKRYYQALVENIPSAIVTVDASSTVTSWNPAAERMFGYTAAEANGRNIDDLVTKDERLRAEAVAISEKGTGGGRSELVTQRQRRDGSLVDVQMVGAPIFVGDEAIGFFAIYNDVSELQRQKQYYVSLLESSPNAIVTLDLDSTVLTWNRAAEELFGYSREEAVGLNVDDLIAGRPEIADEAREMTGHGETVGHTHKVTRRTRKDGSFVDVDIVGARIDIDGEPVGLYAIYSNVSELQWQRRYYQALFELSPAAIITVDTDINVTSWNPAAERMFGYTAEEAIGRNADELVASDPEIRAEAVAESNQRSAAGDADHYITQRNRRDGTRVDVHAHFGAIVVGGERAGIYAVYHDIGELQDARREAEAATEAKSAFLAAMSHEIRTPMNAVIGMTELLLGTALDTEQRGFAEVIRTSGEALLAVINDILDFSKIEAGRLDLESQPFDLRECVESAMELVAPAAAEKALDLAYTLEPGAPEALVGDATRLRQILLNLLNNAVKFTERGEIVLTVDAEPLGGGRHRVCLSVRDTGIGIPDDRLETLFESFTQVDASTTRRYGGTGLGLAISRRLAEAMGGRIWADSRLGEGSTFRVTVVAAEAPRPVRPYEGDAVALLAEKRVLVVDDNATNRQIARAYLESWGMLVRETESPRDAIEWVRRGDPLDAAVLDMHMPELDGLALAGELRKSAARLPLILLTSLGRREDDSELFAAHLTKPIRPSQLYDALVDVLGARAPAPVAAPMSEPAAASPGDLRILVAEDNAVNQQLVQALLSKLGYRADIASNGLEALSALERARYDVVLMDVQMPELDGLEATRRIHARWGAERPHIIAVTAGVMDDEREQCLAAGMDDFVSKPIRSEELAAALGRLRPASAAALDHLRETVGDVTTGAIVETFLVEGPALVARLRQSVDDGDAAGLRLAAHTLKSNASMFGGTALAEVCQELERIGAAGTVDGAAELVGRGEAEYARLEAELR